MTLRQYLSLMLAGTVLSWGAVILIITMIDPTSSNFVVLAIFYISIFLALTGMFSVLGFISRVFILKKRLLLSRQVAVSFRQAVITALLIVTLLFLQSKAMLTWWNALLIVAIMTVVESFFISVASDTGNNNQ
ncbi:hypothetical protein KKF05_00315 [Patescibacteria group bacterium]|nr:hypothetical protein [Patescibacteria group bacterium]MBU1028632.1 hypothetical protein [Patescibacteria group bacterium]